MRLLSEKEISQALESLPRWEHQVDSLARLVPTDDHGDMEHVITQVAGDLREHVRTERTPRGVVVKVSTATMGDVTDSDVEVAAAIDQVIALGGSDTAPRGL